MRRVLRAVLLLLILLGIGMGLFYLFAPREPVVLTAGFDESRFSKGVQAHFDAAESAVPNLRPGVAKRVLWHPGAEDRRTRFSVVYLHGFSATSEEIRPVPDRLAAALGANLVFTRLRGHGRDGAALAEPTVEDWMRDVAEALAAGRATGDRVIVLSTSTGGTLAAAAALDPDLSRDMAAMIFVSPNFGINDPNAWALTLPAARSWLPPLMGGGARCFEPLNDRQRQFWTTCYPWRALMPMAALVETVAGLDFAGATVPALFRFSEADTVVRADLTRRVAGQWGGPSDLQVVEPGPGDDPSSHVIAGDIVSPGQTDASVRDMLAWLRSIGIE